MRRLRNIGRLFTGTSVGVIEDAAVICDGGKIAWCGPQGQEPHEMLEAVTDDDDCGGGLGDAGLVGPPTPPGFAGGRVAGRGEETAGAPFGGGAGGGGGVLPRVGGTR